jgi:CubicO group peptidase (beta-lactamase class C family)
LAKVQKDLDAKCEEFHVPGAALVIVKDDKIVAIQGMGMRDVERKLPITPQTLFPIGSSTKAFTFMTALPTANGLPTSTRGSRRAGRSRAIRRA